MFLKRTQPISGSRIPNWNLPVTTPARNHGSIGGKRYRDDSTHISDGHVPVLIRVRIPQTNQFVITSTGKRGAIRRESNGVDPNPMSVQNLCAFSGAGVPQTNH
jgi:hypothetical protein